MAARDGRLSVGDKILEVIRFALKYKLIRFVYRRESYADLNLKMNICVLRLWELVQPLASWRLRKNL